MKSQLVLIIIAASITTAGCVGTQAQPNAVSSNGEVTKPIAAPTSPDAETEKQEGEEANDKEMEKSPEDLSLAKIEPNNSDRCKGTNNHLFLGNGTTKNKYGNPLYLLHLCVSGKQVKTYEIVTGRVFTQQRNRHQSGTHAPLPNGKYTIGGGLTQGTLIEVGKVDGLNVSKPFLPISPLFKTGRSALGIHVDPSYNKDPKEDGTSGCIGTKNPEDFKTLWADIKQYRVRDLQVVINTKAIDNPDVAER